MTIEPDSLEAVELLFEGRYVGCYTLRTNQGFIAYAKLFAFKPDSVWDMRGAYGKIAGVLSSTPEQALESVISRAIAAIHGLEAGPQARPVRTDSGFLLQLNGCVLNSDNSPETSGSQGRNA